MFFSCWCPYWVQISQWGGTTPLNLLTNFSCSSSLVSSVVAATTPDMPILCYWNLVLRCGLYRNIKESKVTIFKVWVARSIERVITHSYSLVLGLSWLRALNNTSLRVSYLHIHMGQTHSPVLHTDQCKMSRSMGLVGRISIPKQLCTTTRNSSLCI